LTDVEQVFRAEYGRVVAGLVRRFGDIDIAEEALADALSSLSSGGRATAYLPTRGPG
jgi:RNA polymerase sigma-70 factor (ECF subfamily)